MVIFPVDIDVLWMERVIIRWSYDCHMGAIDDSDYTWHTKPLVEANNTKHLFIMHLH